MTKVTWFSRGSGSSGESQSSTVPSTLRSFVELRELDPDPEEPPVSRTMFSEESGKLFCTVLQILRKLLSPVWKPASLSSGKLFWRMYPQELMPPLWRIVLSIHSMNIETLVYVSCRSTCKTKQNVTPFHFYRHNCLAPEPILF